jgi:dienelactone hydrolase
MWTRSRLIALLAALAFVAAACSGGEAAVVQPEASPTTAAAATATREAPAATATATAEPVATSAPRTDGLLGSYSGVAHVPRDPAFTALAGATAYYGELGRAVYRIEMPDDWNGQIVMYAHGFKGFETILDVDSIPRPIREWLIGRGYAWAASSYSENGYEPGIGADDTLALKRYFAKEFGEPGRTYLVGASMGGNVVALSLEHLPGEYDGALAICGALGGETQIDYLVSWAHVGAFLAGTELPLGRGALAIATTLTGDVAPALGTPSGPTQAGIQFASVIRELTGGPRPFFQEGFAEQYVTNFGYVLADPELKTLMTRAATNVGVVYAIEDGLGVTAEEINAGVYRQVADPAARDATAHPDKVPTSGNLSAPMLTLHNTGDLFVPISQEQQYRTAAEAAGKGHLLVQRAIRASGHCQFTNEELTQAFSDLVAWVEDGVRPAGDDLSGDLSDIGLQFTNPLREGDPGGR